MSITVKVHGVEVTCEQPEQAVAIATASSVIKMPKADDIAAKSKGPVKLTFNGVTVECENVESAAATLIAAAGITVARKKKPLSPDAKKSQGSGPQRSWAEAEELAKKLGITRDEARRELAKRKREEKARSILSIAKKKK